MLGPKLGRRSGFRLGEREPAGRRRGRRQTSSRDLLAAKRLLLLSISPGSHKLPAPGTRSGTSRASVGISDERTDPAASPLPEPASEGTDRSRGAQLPRGPVSAPALGTGCPAGSSPSTQQGQDVKTSPPRCQEAEDSFSRGGPPKPGILTSTALTRFSLPCPESSRYSVLMLQPPGSNTDLRAMPAWPQ